MIHEPNIQPGLKQTLPKEYLNQIFEQLDKKLAKSQIDQILILISLGFRQVVIKLSDILYKINVNIFIYIY